MSKRRFPLNKFPELLKNPPPNFDIMLYDKIKKGPVPHPGDNIVKNPTLNKRVGMLETRFDRLDTRMDRLEASFNHLDTRMDRLEASFNHLDTRMDRLEALIANLAKEMRDGFKRVDTRINNLEKDINTRLDNIEKRLDYNNLKQLPK